MATAGSNSGGFRTQQFSSPGHRLLPPLSSFIRAPPSVGPSRSFKFYDGDDAMACSLRLAFLKTLFLATLASGTRCAELAHCSRRGLVDAGSPRFLYKNQASGQSPPPVTVPFCRQHGPWLRCHSPHVPLPHIRPPTPWLCIHTPFLFSFPSCRSPQILDSTGSFRFPPQTFRAQLFVCMTYVSSHSMWTRPDVRSYNISNHTGLGHLITRFCPITSLLVLPFFPILLRQGLLSRLPPGVQCH